MQEKTTPKFAATLLAMVVPALVGLTAVYVIAGRGDNSRGTVSAPVSVVTSAQAQAAAPAPLPAGAGSNPLSQGEMATFVFRKAPEALPAVAFTDGTGAGRTLADFKGKVVLLNLWATWCIPCLKEMPGLDRLQKELGSDKFEVVALSVDRKGPEASRKFLDQIKVEHLKLYADATAKAGSALKVLGMPTTLLLNAKGEEIGRLIGPAEWDSADAKKLIQAALR
jgi:thiol-disulfide isomerase/thioredoxin